MESAEKRKKAVRLSGTVLLCVLLITCLLARPIKQTIAYIQATSGTCINTFVGETSEAPTKPTEPSKPTDPTKPEDPTKPQEPTEPTKATEPTNSTETSTGGTEAPKDETKKPRTGDEFNAGLWGALAATSLLIMIAAVLYRSKATKKTSKKEKK